jgi:uncharacterized membrane protein/protein-disulfide isomerase
MAAKTRNLLLAFAAFGLGASIWSSYVHYALLTRSNYTSFCDVNDTVSCTQAYLSQYGSLWGVPVALGGVFYFTFVVLMVGVGGRRGVQARDNIPAYVFAVSTLALAFVLYLAWASFFKLHAVCMLCAATYLAVIGIFIISGGATKFPMTSLPRRASTDVAALLKSPFALVLALVFSVGAVSLINAFPREGHLSATSTPAQVARQFPPLTDQQRFDFLRWLDVQPKEDVPVDAGGAKVVIVKFNDYQCPGCKDVYFLYKDMLARYAASGKVKSITKHYPLEPECNAAVPGGNHFLACEAAAAIVMTQTTGTADKLEEWLFSNQTTLTAASVKQAAADIGGITDFDARYAQALTSVRADAALGSQLKVKSTPTFFLNGRRIEGGLPPPALEAAIEHELKR